MLESIREPSKTIKQGYESVAVLMLSGKILTGRVLEEDDDTLTLMVTDNLQTRKEVLSREDIDDLAPQKVSVMPVGLLDGLNVSQVDDLLSYVARIADPDFTEPAAATIPAKLPGVTREPVDVDATFYTPEESMERIYLAPGYHLELVAAEPMIEEPVLCVWDGNNRMYVAEMRTYMQDAEGTDQDLPKSRISMLEDTDGDGRMDRVTRFIDNLVLPRMILPLDDRIIVNETYTKDYYSYRDTDGDGVADEKILLSPGDRQNANLEHQDSGMTWGIDNWIYTAQTGIARHQFLDGQWKSEPLYGDNGQWGLAMNDVGRFFLSAAGGENPAYGFQQLPHYGRLSLPGEREANFDQVYPVLHMTDVQGGPGRVDPKRGALNRFTGCAGQSIYRGDQMPADFQGDYILPEPVGRLIRRAHVTSVDGKYVLSNAYKDSEFIASSDKNFRPVWSATGPDGCLYIVDMYRGIIQEGNWTRKGSYLRGVIDEEGFAKNIGRGRIYRVVHETTRRQAPPKLLEQTSSQLVDSLSHPNGWRRDTAQKLLVLRQDLAVVESLRRLATKGEAGLGRMHALWTLDGLGASERRVLEIALQDSDGRVRMAAMRIAEPLLRVEATSPTQEDTAVGAQLAQAIAIAGYHDDAEVAVQAINSLRYAEPELGAALIRELVAAYPTNDVVLASSQLSMRFGQGGGGPSFANLDPQMLEQMKQGYQTYTLLCTRCHGPDGKGAISSDGLQLAPSLVQSPRLLGGPDLPTRIVLHGLMGPIEGKTYPGLMESMKREDDAWIASVLTFVRNSFGNAAPAIRPQDVARVRAMTADRTEPFRIEELTAFQSVPQQTLQSWNYSSSVADGGSVGNAIDGRPETRFDTRAFQVPGQWFQFDMKQQYQLSGIVLDTSGSSEDYPRGYEVQFSDDGQQWSEPVLSGRGDGAVTYLDFPEDSRTRFVRITQTGSSNSKFWSIHELVVYGQAVGAK